MATWEFTEAERHEIDNANRKIINGEMLTTEEALIYARFEAYKAISNEEFKAKQEINLEQSKIEIEESKKTAKAAREVLRAQKEKALERYERTLTNV